MEVVVGRGDHRGGDSAASLPSGMPAPDDLPDGLIVGDAQRRVVVFNATAARLIKMDPNAALGRDLPDVLPLHDAEGRDWWKCLDPYGGLSTRTRHPERPLYLPDGTELLVTAAYRRDAERR